VINASFINTSGSSSTAIILLEAGSADPDYTNITLNSISTTGTSAMGVRVDRDITETYIFNNNITAANRGIYLHRADYSKVINNTINTSNNGIYLFRSVTFNLIDGNTINSTSNTIFIDSDGGFGNDGNNFTNNIIYGDGSYGISLAKGTINVQVTGNSIYVVKRYVTVPAV